MEKVEGRVGSELRGEGEKRWNERGVRSGGGEGVNQGDLARSLGETERRLLSKGGQMVIALLLSPHIVTMVIQHSLHPMIRSISIEAMTRNSKLFCGSLNHQSEVTVHRTSSSPLLLLLLSAHPSVPDSVSQCQSHYPRRSFDERPAALVARSLPARLLPRLHHLPLSLARPLRRRRRAGLGSVPITQHMRNADQIEQGSKG